MANRFLRVIPSWILQATTLDRIETILKSPYSDSKRSIGVSGCVRVADVLREYWRGDHNDNRLRFDERVNGPAAGGPRSRPQMADHGEPANTPRNSSSSVSSA